MPGRLRVAVFEDPEEKNVPCSGDTFGTLRLEATHTVLSADHFLISSIDCSFFCSGIRLFQHTGCFNLVESLTEGKLAYRIA